MSGSVVAWKYFLLGCSLVLCSREYCSILFKRYERLPNSSLIFSKNSPDCLPISSIHIGGRLSISVILDTWLYSEDPGNRGRPRKSSTTMHPRDHISMADEYLLKHISNLYITVTHTKIHTEAPEGPRETDRTAIGCKCTQFVSRHTPSRNQ